jgi:cytochrome P450
MVPLYMHGLDEERWDNPLEVNFEREDVRFHASFGNGPHKCPGSNLARVETRIFLEEWLKRIPDFEITPGKNAVTKSGNMNSVHSLPLSWTT